MTQLPDLFSNNRRWSEGIKRREPGFFDRLARQQAPRYLWIGCSDSRVPANEIVGLMPGELFVHRNVANIVVHSDLNCLSVLQYAVEVLKVEHVIVCGHYGCGGVKAAMSQDSHGLIDNWLRTLKDTQQYFWSQLDPLDETARFRRMVELNVIEQVYNLGKTNIVAQAWNKTGRPYIHG